MNISGKITGFFILFLFAAFIFHWYRGLDHGMPREPFSETQPSLNDLSWLSGYWTGEGSGERTEELWSLPRGNMMLGFHRTVSQDSSTFFEYLRIEKRPEGIFYTASPSDRPAVSFALTGSGNRKIVFENPDHDHPKRIIYWLEGKERLHARIEGDGGSSDSQEWIWYRTPFSR